MSEPYEPIDCALYSRYERAIIHRQLLRLGWHNEASSLRLETVRPLDLRTHEHAKYLIAETLSACTPLRLRLDHIRHTDFL